MSEKDSVKKGKATIKRGKTEAPSRQQAPIETRRSKERQAAKGQAVEMQDASHPEVVVRIQQQAYRLFEAAGSKHGHALEHWLEAERQITGSSVKRSSSNG